MAASRQTLSADAVRVRLKWFNIPKGFGFVIPENEDIDVFLHITKLQQARVNSLGEGACLLCHIEQGEKGAQVSEVLELLDAGTQPEPLPAESSARGNRRQSAWSQLAGTVKLYNAEKGFGFVMADDGQKDVFLHRRCLKRCGLATIEPGTRVIMNVRPTPRGREVVDFMFCDE
jgi:cold shock protein